ncbi:hypothetical protein Patl1_14744 [Pistacia atlantica]|uniref:Uncharacterized protein n=1 Tax=Pistacia atlantica TaxID=434234 RepID=A0ACC1AWX2_9ROSI|nr:hypothetical protein Patl1_14744 [Pistacia atlantica]
MERLLLSALKWKMRLVTPLSFLGHIIRRLGLKEQSPLGMSPETSSSL